MTPKEVARQMLEIARRIVEAAEQAATHGYDSDIEQLAAVCGAESQALHEISEALSI